MNLSDQEGKDSRRSTANALRFSGIGFQLLAIIALFSFAGHKADEAFNNQVPWLTALLSLAGIFLGLYFAYRQVRQ